MKKIPASIADFLRTGIWRIPVKDLSRPKAFLVRTFQVLLLAIRGFQEDRCSVKASALTFYSLLSVVPVIAMVFGIAKGFGFEKKLQNQLLVKFSGQEDVLLRIFAFSDSLLQKTRGGVVAGIGVALLFWSVIKVLGYIEHSFNDIWKVETHRSLARKSSDYLSVMLVCPVIFLMASSLTVTMASRVKGIAETVSEWGLPQGPILLLLDMIPFLLIWILFAFLYIYMPNTRVRYRAGLIAGVATGTVYQVTQWIYIAFQVGVARANAIYGSFAALPLFLVWMQLSWLIVLMGSEISFAIQNVNTLGYPSNSRDIRPPDRKRLSLLIARLVVRNFSEGEKPLTDTAIAGALEMPITLVRGILSDLSAGGVFSVTVAEEQEEGAYQPALDIHRITVKHVLDALERGGSVELEFPATEEVRAVSDALEIFRGTVEKSPANKRVMDL